jgi:hypothetical protein
MSSRASPTLLRRLLFAFLVLFRGYPCFPCLCVFASLADVAKWGRWGDLSANSFSDRGSLLCVRFSAFTVVARPCNQGRSRRRSEVFTPSLV